MLVGHASRVHKIWTVWSIYGDNMRGTMQHFKGPWTNEENEPEVRSTCHYFIEPLDRQKEKPGYLQLSVRLTWPLTFQYINDHTQSHTLCVISWNRNFFRWRRSLSYTKVYMIHPWLLLRWWIVWQTMHRLHETQKATAYDTHLTAAQGNIS